MVCIDCSVIWWQGIYLDESCGIFFFFSIAFLRNGILLRTLQTLHWQLSKNGLGQPLSKPLSGLQHRCDNQGPRFWKVFLFCLPPSFQSSLEFSSHESPIVCVSLGSPTPCRGRNASLLGLALSLNLIQQVTKPHLYGAPQFYHNSLSVQLPISSRARRRHWGMKPIYPHFLNWHT